jgi:competence protein ComEC
MTLAALGFLAGIVLFQGLTSLPPPLPWGGVVVALLAVGWAVRPLRPLGAVTAGWCWAWLWAAALLADNVDTVWEGRDVELVGVVTSMPQQRELGVRFEFQVEALRYQGNAVAGPRRVMLSWYQGPPPLVAGERWRLTARLKRPHGLRNPGAFDYETWLFSQRIRGVGYVRAGGEAERLGTDDTLFGIERQRQRLRTRLDEVLAERPMRGLVEALTVGETAGISAAQWEVLGATGTNHLMAISGMHISLVAGGVFLAARRLWSLAGPLPLGWPAPKAAAVAALLAALGYAALAGFSVPTQRAAIMVAVVLGTVLAGRSRPGMHTLALALIAVLLWSPLAVLSPGFWLSFGAVAWIGFAMGGRWAPGGWWWRWGRLQWLMTFALAPLLVLFFGYFSAVSPIANCVAIPWVELLVVPIALSGVVCLAIAPELGALLLQGAELLLRPLWWVLQQLAWLPGSRLYIASPPTWMLVCGAVAVVLAFAPRGLPARWLAAVWCLPLLLWRAPTPDLGDAWLTQIDVGQGLATLIRTRSHTLVYDTGPRFSEGLDAGAAAIVPYLQRRGLPMIDTLVVGHGDSDHIGGAESLLRQIEVGRVLTTVPAQLAGHSPELCAVGERWQWDGVEFEVLHPDLPLPLRDNDSSCVLRVRSARGAFLLVGDIEAAAEMTLLRRYGDTLRSAVLVAPHHGSATSSTGAFLDAVAPQLALFAVGYRNRFGFPRHDVVQRYQARDIVVLDTARRGAIEVYFAADGTPQYSSFRQHSRHYWHWWGEI